MYNQALSTIAASINVLICKKSPKLQNYMMPHRFKNCAFSYPAKTLRSCFQIHFDNRSSSDKSFHFRLFVFETP